MNGWQGGGQILPPPCQYDSLPVKHLQIEVLRLSFPGKDLEPTWRWKMPALSGHPLQVAQVVLDGTGANFSSVIHPPCLSKGALSLGNGAASRSLRILACSAALAARRFKARPAGSRLSWLEMPGRYLGKLNGERWVFFQLPSGALVSFFLGRVQTQPTN